MLKITQWKGRNGNNILQIIRAIYYGILHNFCKVIFPLHNLLTKTEIIIINSKDNNLIIEDDFFYLNKFNICDPEPIEMKHIFMHYIKPIFNICLYNTLNQDSSLYVHLRGGDIFSKSPHSYYVPPPLHFYEQIIAKYNKVILIAEDSTNPCIHKLLNLPNTSVEYNMLKDDLQKLSNIENLVIGFGTFGFLLYLINPFLKNIYMPRYVINELPKGLWGDDITIHIIDLPDYIKVGEWNNTDEQQELILNYKYGDNK